MKLFKRIAAFCLALSIGFSLMACGGPGNESTTAATDPGSSTTAAPSVSGTYSISLLTEGGMALEGVGIYIYEDATKQELVWFAKTDDKGEISFTAPAKEGYVAFLDKVPEGYDVQECYALTGEKTSIVLGTKLVSGGLEGINLKLGDVMYDLSVTDTQGNTWQISQLLQEKKAVVLNFWFLSCTPCKMEFPHLQKAYEEYGDEVAVLALNPVDTDAEAVAKYAQELGLTMPVGLCDPAIQSALQMNAYPTTVVIDRYGIISLIHEGSIPSTNNFKDIMAHYAAEDYQQEIVTDVNSLFVSGPDAEDDVVINNPTEVGGVTSFQLTVRPGETVYCDVYRVFDMYLTIKSENAELTVKGKTYKPSKGQIGMTINAPDTFTPVAIALKNTGTEIETYTIKLNAKSGSLNNPKKMTLGEFNVSISSGKQEGVYYRYTAEADGYLVVHCTSATAGVPYGFTLYNLKTYANRNLEADGQRDADGNPMVRIKVSKGQKVQFNPSALPDDSGNYPGIKLTFFAELVSGEDDGGEEEVAKTVYAVTVTDEERNPVSGVSVYIALPDGKTQTLTTNEKGVAAAKLEPGTYKATVKIPTGYAAKTTELTLTEQIPVQSVKLDTVVTEKADYTVQVVDEAGKGISGVLVSVGSSFAQTDANGSVTFTLIKGSYTAAIGLPDGYTAENLSHDFGEGTSLTVVLKKAETNPDQPPVETIAYTVKVTDYFGKSMSNVTVSFLRDGSVVGMQSVDANGTAVIQLEKGTYSAALAFASGDYHYDTDIQLTEEAPSVTVKATKKLGDSYMELYVGDAYALELGATYVDGMQTNVVNYFTFTPQTSGIYKFTTSDPSAVISYWGGNTAYIQEQTNATDYKDNAFTREVREENLGGDATVFILGVTGAKECVISITRIADIVLTDEEKAEWIDFEGKYTPAEGYVYKLNESGKQTYIDITGATAANTPVLGDDGNYHLGSKNGPVLYVNLGPNGYHYINFYQMMGNEQAGGARFSCVFYEGDKFIKKEMYNNCLKAYTQAVDAEGLGLYPLNDDLIYMIKNGGAQLGWWDKENLNYLFEDLPINTDIAWMFNVCYFA